MRKYGKLFIIAAVIVLAIGTFYIQSALSASQYPEFKINKKDGNEKEIKSIVVDGMYNQGPISEGLQLTSEGSHYYSEAPFVDQINEEYQPVLIKQLQKEYRNFMRGKTGDPSKFFENDALLAYADVKYQLGPLGVGPIDFKFEISILDKQADTINSFELEGPNGNNLDYIDVEEVRMVNDEELKVITVNSLAGEEGGSEIHVYTFDITTNQLSDDKTIKVVSDQRDDHYVEMNIVERTSRDPEKSNVLFIKRDMVNNQTEEGYEQETVNEELIGFNLETNKKEDIKFPEMTSQDAQPAYYDGSSIYFTWMDDKGFQVASYNIKDQKIEKQTTVKLSGVNDEYGDPVFTIKDNKLYLVSQQVVPEVYVIDLQSGKKLYQGEIVVENPSADEMDYELYFSDIEVK